MSPHYRVFDLGYIRMYSALYILWKRKADAACASGHMVDIGDDKYEILDIPWYQSNF